MNFGEALGGLAFEWQGIKEVGDHTPPDPSLIGVRFDLVQTDFETFRMNVIKEGQIQVINSETSPEYFYEGSIFKSANKKTAVTIKNPEDFDLKSSIVSPLGQYIKFKVYKA